MVNDYLLTELTISYLGSLSSAESIQIKTVFLISFLMY